MKIILLMMLWVLTPQGLQIGEIFYNNQNIKIMKMNLKNPAFLQSGSNVSGEIVPAGNPYYVKGREDNTTVTFVFPEYTQVSSDGVSYADAQGTHVINAGEKLYIKYKPITSPIAISDNTSAFSIDKGFDAGGVMEPVLINFSYGGDTYDYTIFSMEELPIIDAKKLIIDITGVTNSLVCSFDGCTSLINAPKLPATTLESNCYSNMFRGCTSLVNAPELPATTLASGCYGNMFYGCTSLVDAPELPATTLAGSCYYNMFYGCTSLVNAPELPATTLEQYCYYNMFYGCTSLANAPELYATTLAEHCCDKMFLECINLVNVPKLHATTLASDCCLDMFQNCTSLVNAPELPATTLAAGCYRGMFYGCTSLVNAPELPATTLEVECYHRMFSGCTSLVNAPELPATTLEIGCYMYMFYNCTNLVNAPELPATTLEEYCYDGMFSGCIKISSITVLATTFESNSTQRWLENASPTGIFTKAAGVDWPTGDSGIPEGWTVQEYAGDDFEVGEL